MQSRKLSGAVSLVLAGWLSGCGQPAPQTTPSAKPTGPSPTATVPVTAEPGGTFSCANVAGGTDARARITDIRIGSTQQSDTLVVEFDHAVTRFQIETNPNGTTFSGGGGKGGTYQLSGRYGLQLNIDNLDWTVPPGNQYPHGTDLSQSAPSLIEVQQIGDFEGVVNVAIALAQPVCPKVSTLSDPPRLVIQFAAK